MSEDPELWSDPERATAIGKERKALEGVVSVIDKTQSTLDDSLDLLQIAEEDGDEETVRAVADDVAEVERVVADLEFKKM